MVARPWFTWAFAIAASSALVLASGVARADDGDGIPDEIEDLAERTVLTNVFPEPAPRTLSILSESSGAPVDDKFRVTYESGRFELRYSRNASDDPYASYTVELRKLLEWLDGNADGLFQENEAVAEWGLGGDAFGNSTLSHASASNEDGGNVETFLVRAAVGAASEVALGLTIAERFMRIAENRVLTPMEVKLDVYVNHTLESPAARVGVEFHLETDAENAMSWDAPSWDVQQGFSEDESWMNITSAAHGSTMFFSWTNRALVDGRDGAVLASIVPSNEGSEKSYDVHLLYPSGLGAASVRIAHDPTLGVVSTAYEAILGLPGEPRLVPDFPLYVVSLVAVAGILAATVLLARRRRQT